MYDLVVYKFSYCNVHELTVIGEECLTYLCQILLTDIYMYSFQVCVYTKLKLGLLCYITGILVLYFVYTYRHFGSVL